MNFVYQRAWWHHLGQGTLRIVAFYDEARDAETELVGVVPLFLTADHALHFVGCKEVSDYLDLLIEADYRAEAYRALIDLLNSDTFRAETAWQRLALCSLPQTSPTLTEFAEQMTQVGWQVEQSRQDVCPVIEIGEFQTFDDYLATIKKKQRHEIRRKMRKIQNEAMAEFIVYDQVEGLDEVIDRFVVLHRKSTPDKDDFWTPELLAFFKAVTRQSAEAGWLKLYFLQVDGVDAAAMLCFDYNNEFLLYNSGYDPEFNNLSVGNVLTSYTIEQAITLGRTRYDFLRGDEEYKFRYGAVAEPVYDLEITRG